MKDRNDLPMLAVKRPLLIGVLNLLIVIAGIAGALILVGATAAWVVDERAGADAANRIFHRGLSSDGPLMGWPVLLFGLVGVVIALAIGISLSLIHI